MTRPFTSRAEFYDKDREKASNINIGPARLTTPNGEHEPAIALFNREHIIAVLPTNDAYRIATAIADQLTTIRQGNA